MNILTLDNGYDLAIENADKKIRLVVYNNGVENVCRKSTLKNIATFVQSGENHLFKGRLQLQKENSGINILVKGSKVGEIPIQGFLSYLQQFKAAPKRRSPHVNNPPQ